MSKVKACVRCMEAFINFKTESPRQRLEAVLNSGLCLSIGWMGLQVEMEVQMELYLSGFS